MDEAKKSIGVRSEDELLLEAKARAAHALAERLRQMAGGEKRSTVWENFDALATEAVERKITFDEFATRANSDFGRMAAIACRRRRPPVWMSVEDVKIEIIRLAWHYGFERVDTRGNVGFQPSMYRSAGAYLRFKVRNKIAKVLSSARGESQHTRRGPGRPEFLSKTGELPEEATEPTAERALASARQKHALDRFVRAVREMIVAREVAPFVGTDAALARCFLDRPARTGDEFVRSMRELGIVTDADARRAVAALRSAGIIPRSKRKVANGVDGRSSQDGEGLGSAA